MYWRLVDANKTCNHGLRGSASSVLTATGSVNGRGQFLTPPPQNPHPLTDITQHHVDIQAM